MTSSKTILFSKFIMLLLLNIGLTACMTISRNPSSGYNESGRLIGADDDSEYDYESTRELSPAEREKLEERMLLSRLEKSIGTSSEKSQYLRYKNTFENDRERIEFLSLDDLTSKERYIRNKGYATSASRYTRDVASLIETNDIAVGMSREAVRESWGDPNSVEYAGRMTSGNERWKYTEYVVTPEGYQEEQRLLYFENGMLVGWEKF